MIIKQIVLKQIKMRKMRYYIIAIFFIMIFGFCKNQQTKKDTEKISLKELFSFPVVSPSSIAFGKDSIMQLQILEDGGETYYTYTRYFIENRHDSIVFSDRQTDLTKQLAGTLGLRMQKADIFFNDILSPSIDYSLSDLIGEDTLKKTALACVNVLSQKKDGYNYSICNGLCKNILIYDSINKHSSVIDLFDNYTSVKSFFLYDITRDNKPELIIFSDSPIVRKQKIIIVNIFFIEGIMGH
jgi:hypothetical protein